MQVLSGMITNAKGFHRWLRMWQILTLMGQVPCIFNTFFSTLLVLYIRGIHCLEHLAYISSNHRPEYDLLLILGN